MTRPDRRNPWHDPVTRDAMLRGIHLAADKRGRPKAKPLHSRICEECAAPFETENSRQRFCGRLCAAAHNGRIAGIAAQLRNMAR